MRRRAARSSSSRDQRLAAFEGEALLPDVPRMQVFFERLGGRQALEDPLFDSAVKPGRRAGRLDRCWTSAAAPCRRCTCTRRRASRNTSPAGLQDSRRHRACRPHQRARVEFGLHIGVGEAVERGVELRRRAAGAGAAADRDRPAACPGAVVPRSAAARSTCLRSTPASPSGARRGAFPASPAARTTAPPRVRDVPAVRARSELQRSK